MMWKAVILVVSLSSVAFAQYQLANESYTFTLECSSPDPVEYWLLHSTGHAYMTGGSYEEDTIHVDDHGCLTFDTVKVSHEGTHLCVTKTTEMVHAHPIKLRVRKLPPSDLWKDVYQAQFLTGIIAALICAMIFGVSCLVYNYRWRPEGPDTECMITEGGQCNPAVEIEVDIHEEENNTKM